MRKTTMAVATALSALSIQSALAAEYSEKTQYLGVVNGGGGQQCGEGDTYTDRPGAVPLRQ